MSGSVRVLITGGAGFIGSHTADLLLEEGFKVGVYDALISQVHPGGDWPSWTKAQTGAQLFRGCVLDRQRLHEVLTEFRPQAIIHLAAEVGVGQAETDMARYVRTNVLGTTVLLEEILRANDSVTDDRDGIRRLIVAGSMSAYGEGMYACPSHGPVRTKPRTGDRMAEGKWDPICPFDDARMKDERCPTPEDLKPIPIAEWASLRPAGIYAETKRAQEDLSLLFGQARGVSVAVTRLFNVMGSRQALSNPYTGVGAIFASRALAGLAPRVYEDGQQFRDFIHVQDVAHALMCLLGTWQLKQAVRCWANPNFQGVFNVGTGKPTTILELATLISERLGGPAPEVTGLYRTGDIRGCIADTQRLREATGWAPRVPLKAAVEELCAAAKRDFAKVPEGTDLEAAHRELEHAGLLMKTQIDESELGDFERQPEEGESRGAWVE